MHWCGQGGRLCRVCNARQARDALEGGRGTTVPFGGDGLFRPNHFRPQRLTNRFVTARPAPPPPPTAFQPPVTTLPNC